VRSPKSHKKPRVVKKAEKRPAIYYSDNPVSLNEWQAGKSSPNPKAPRTPK